MPTTVRLHTGTALAAAAIALTVAGTTAAVAGDRDGGWDSGRETGREGSWNEGPVGSAGPVGNAGPVGDEGPVGNEGPAGNWDTGRDRGKPARLELSPRHVRPGTTVVARTTACGREGSGRGFAESVGAGQFRLERRATPKDAVAGEFRVARHARTGTHSIRVRCDNGREARGELFVEHGGPTGHVRTGVGGSVAPDTTQIAAGVAMLAAAAVGGTWLLRRRASGTRAS
ncbi:hypothetical protein [Streptomyces sp. 35G-GA-8]|uniref:hypothetical protein n=1 Tax=Streptomyces sp. 35G-GA-8 TaxID=2939434 RepID=UPI00201E98FA|nr:hypothetical protein [Streptomyces sp. 35G-GA-8]MCL7377252.1 hypothetical protein [Streptomyces sp. 35G-GA-8]